MLTLVHSAGHFQARTLGAAVEEIEMLPAGTVLTAEQEQTMADWDAFLEQQFVAPELVAQQLDVMQSGYITGFVNLAPINLILQT